MPRCKSCREKFTPVKFNMKYCLKQECLKVFVEESKEKMWKQTKVVMKNNIKTNSDWLKEAQVIFNRYIRERDKAQPCISCGSKLGSKYDAGHFYSMGGHKAVTFDEDNVHAQCVTCNRFRHGHLINYREGLLKRIGEAKLDALSQRANETRKYSNEELQELIKKYKKKISELN